MARKRKSRAEWIDERLEELGLTQAQLLAQMDLARETFRRVRLGQGSHPRTTRNVEAALYWADGALADIDEGREPRVVDVDAILARPLPQLARPTATDDLSALLRSIRQAMGPAGFWQEIGTMQVEENTESDRPHATG